MMGKSSSFEQNIKLLLLGDSGVGKTSLMMRFSEQTFSSTFVSTVGIDFKYKMVTIDAPGSSKPVTVRLELWDTAGQERFKSITTSYLRGAQGILVCYDITDRKTFQRVDAWMHDIQQYAELSVTLVLVGTKTDLEAQRAVMKEEGQALAEAHGIAFFEVSAKNQIGVNAPFEFLAKKVFERLQKTGVLKAKQAIDVAPTKPEASSSCC
jgi:small GTP-binding protein